MDAIDAKVMAGKVEVVNGDASCVSFVAENREAEFVADVDGKECLVVGDDGVVDADGGFYVDFNGKSDAEKVEEISREKEENGNIGGEDDHQVEAEEINESATQEPENLIAETSMESEAAKAADENKILSELDVALVVESDAAESEHEEEPGNLDAESQESEIVTEEAADENEIHGQLESEKDGDLVDVALVVESDAAESEHEEEPGNLDAESQKSEIVTEEAADENEIHGELESEKDGDSVEKQAGASPNNGSDVSICTDADEADLVSASKDDDEKSSSVEAESNERIKEAPMEGLSSSASHAEGPNENVLERSECWLVKVPWLHDAEMNAKVQHAHSRFHELLKARKAIEAEYNEQKVKVHNLQEMRDAARAEERPARNAVAAKRKEIDAAEGMLGVVKKATALNDIKDKIKKIEHTIGHETLSVKQEKAYIHEIKQLKIELKSFSSNVVQNGNEVQGSLDEKQIMDRLKMLMMELEPLRTVLFRAEDRRLSAEKNLQEEREHQNHLRAQQNLAHNDCQNAYSLWQKLRSESNEERKHRREYLEDRDTAQSLRSSGDIEKLSCHCDNQIKKIIDLWNTDEKFRKRYIESNTMSTWRRFKTLDGRSLGLNEKPHVLPSNVGKNTMTAPRSSSNASWPASSSGAKESSSSPSNQVPLTSVKTNKAEEEAEGVRPTTTTSMDELKEMIEKAEELAQKVEEEAKRAKMEAELKEQLRSEQKAKEKKAEERKTKQAEKARAIAELKAKKEEELKAKKKAKKERKKQKAAAAAAAETSASVERGATESSETETDPEAEIPAAIEPTTSSQPPKSASKHKLVQPQQVILRNRHRRKWRTWMWMAAVIFLVVGLFYLGNHIAIPRSLQ